MAVTARLRITTHLSALCLCCLHGVLLVSLCRVLLPCALLTAPARSCIHWVLHSCRVRDSASLCKCSASVLTWRHFDAQRSAYIRRQHAAATAAVTILALTILSPPAYSAPGWLHIPTNRLPASMLAPFFVPPAVGMQRLPLFLCCAGGIPSFLSYTLLLPTCRRCQQPACHVPHARQPPCGARAPLPGLPAFFFFLPICNPASSHAAFAATCPLPWLLCTDHFVRPC